MRRLTMYGLMVLAVAAGGNEPAGPPSAFPGSVTTSTDGREVAVVGYIFDDGSSVRVCEALAESYPPQCGGSSATVVGLDTASVDGISAEGNLSWTDFPVELVGETAGGSLRYLRHVALDG